jgi:hypothetical protein
MKRKQISHFPALRNHSKWTSEFRLCYSTPDRKISHVRFDVLILLIMENTTWNVTWCSSIEIHEDFKQTYCFHPHGQGVSQASNWQGGSKWMSGWLLASLTLWLWRWRQYSPLKYQLTSTGLQCVIPRDIYCLQFLNSNAEHTCMGLYDHSIRNNHQYAFSVIHN